MLWFIVSFEPSRTGLFRTSYITFPSTRLSRTTGTIRISSKPIGAWLTRIEMVVLPSSMTPVANLLSGKYSFSLITILPSQLTAIPSFVLGQFLASGVRTDESDLASLEALSSQPVVKIKIAEIMVILAACFINRSNIEVTGRARKSCLEKKTSVARSRVVIG